MEDIDNNLYSYFTSRDIKIVTHSFENTRNKVSLDDFKEQINNIITFQNILKGYKDNILPRIGASIGKELEGYKIQVKRLEIDLERINDKLEKEVVDIFILEEGEKLLNIAKIAIEHVEDNNYIELIRRSMLNYEVCLGNVNESNLIRNESGNLEIGTIKYLTYNLIEHDAYSYLRYIKKSNLNADMEQLIEYFVSESLLEEDSFEYLRGLMSYPLESLRLWDKYRVNKKNLTQRHYIDAFHKAKKNDSSYLIVRGGFFCE